MRTHEVNIDQGGERFLPQSPVDIVNLKNDSWLFSYMAKAPQLGKKKRNQREAGNHLFR
jgi:hypothetical protein